MALGVRRLTVGTLCGYTTQLKKGTCLKKLDILFFGRYGSDTALLVIFQDKGDGRAPVPSRESL